MRLCTCADTTERTPYNAIPPYSPLRGMRCHTIRSRRDCTNLATRDWCGMGGVSPQLLCDDCSDQVERHVREFTGSAESALPEGDG